MFRTLTRKDITVILLSFTCSVLVVFAPDYIFSPEEFANKFYPYGGITHEISFAVIISFLFLLFALFSKITHKNIIYFSFITAFFISSLELVSFIITGGARVPTSLGIIAFLLGIIYYSVLFSVPALSIGFVRNMVIKLSK